MPDNYLYVILFNLCNDTPINLLFPFTEENWGLERPNDLPKVTQYISGRAKICTGVVITPEPLISTTMLHCW